MVGLVVGDGAVVGDIYRGYVGWNNGISKQDS